MYSQHDEEKHILEAVKDIPDGTFLDIGAFDGHTFSNTAALADLGWKGICVEPANQAFLALLKTAKERWPGQIHSVNAAIAPEGSGLMKFWQSADMVSTLSEGHKEIWGDTVKDYELKYVPTFSFRQLLSSGALPFNKFDVVNLDAEGCNWGIFLEIIQYAHHINRVLVVEFDNKKDEMLRAAMSKGFQLVHTTEENMVFVKD